MANLLPERNKKSIRREYLLRLLGVFLIFSAITLFLVSIFLLPSFFLSKNKAGLANEKIEFLKSYIEKISRSGITDLLIETNRKIEILGLSEEKSLNEAISLIIDKKNNSILITDFALRITEDEVKGKEKSLFVGGLADNRSSLISFVESLESISGFKNIDLPVSNLAQNEDIDFSLKVEFDLDK